MANGPEGAAPEQAAEQGGDQLSTLLQNLTQGMQILSEVLAEARPDLAEKMAPVQQGFTALVQEIAGGASQPQADGGAPMEAGAAEVRPDSPAQR